MLNLRHSVFAALSLPLLLAACGTSASTPIASAASLVKLSVRASAETGALKTQSFRTLGLPTLPTGAVPTLAFSVKVRDAQGRLMVFKNGAYDPTGTGVTSLTLNSVNSFAQVVLLPAGSYTFENVAKDDVQGDLMYAYGPATENQATVSGESGTVALKYHAVFNPAMSKLDFGSSVAQLFTNNTFNLNLVAQTAAHVAGQSDVQANVPTSDLGAVSYALGAPTDGTLNGAGSKLGVNVTARGTDTRPVVAVTASFSAWIRSTDGLSASFVPTTLSFSHAVVTNTVRVDTVAPVATVNPVAPGAVINLGTAVSGSATDDVQVSKIQLFDNQTLVASLDAADGVTRINSDANGSWNTTWFPASVGSHDLTVVATDSSGNESRSTVTSPAAAYRTLKLGTRGAYVEDTFASGKNAWYLVDATDCTDCRTSNEFQIYLDGCRFGFGAALMPITGSASYGGADLPNTGYQLYDGCILHTTWTYAQPFFMKVGNNDVRPLHAVFEFFN